MTNLHKIIRQSIAVCERAQYVDRAGFVDCLSSSQKLLIAYLSCILMLLSMKTTIII